MMPARWRILFFDGLIGAVLGGILTASLASFSYAWQNPKMTEMEVLRAVLVWPWLGASAVILAAGIAWAAVEWSRRPRRRRVAR